MFETVTTFEEEIANFFGSPYAIAVDCCTHGLELCLRYENIQEITVPKRTYLSVPMLAAKLNIGLKWKNEEWKDYYYLGGTNIVDAAVLWERGSYIPGTYMCVSFQYRKHLSLGRGGIILTDDEKSAKILKMMSYDGRDNSTNEPWVKQDVKHLGYHYYMTPETAQNGLDKLPAAIENKPRKWNITDWPDLTTMTCFKKGKQQQ
jgi:dTDP-4-amino-4,6-dideoxygalactose transaminase